MAAKRKKKTAAGPVAASTPPIQAGEIAEEPMNPIIGLHVLPAGPRYLFDETQKQGKRHLVIGAAEGCDIRLSDPFLSADHCVIVCQQSRVYINDLGSKNGVWVAGCRVQSCELHDGAVITLGRTTIVAVGRESAERMVLIAAATLREFLEKAVDVYGTKRAAADGIGVPYTTLRDWLKTR